MKHGIIESAYPPPGTIFASRLSQVVASPTPSSSKQMAGLALAEVSPPTGWAGILLGIDLDSGWPIIHDPFTAYQVEKGFSSPNVVVFGDLGAGKSFSVKCWIIRNLCFGRRVIVVDKKLQDDGAGDRGGEYSAMCRALGYPPITLKAGGGGGVKVNILDPRIAGDTRDGAAGQQLLLELVASAALDRPLTEVERKATREARKRAITVASARGEIAHVGHVVQELLNPTVDEDNLPAGVRTRDELILLGRECGFALERLVSEELAGLIDGPTDEQLDLDGALICFDISSLPEDGPAVGIMMSVLNTWMRAIIAATPVPVPTLFVLDEAWHIVTNPYFSAAARRNAKVARGIGLSNVTLFQHPTDVPAESPAVSMIKEAQTAFVFRQDKTEDAMAVCELFGWPDTLVPRLQRLETGVCLFKAGMAPPVRLRVIASDFEALVANTDQAMQSSARLESGKDA